jgi:hypothetical protein
MRPILLTAVLALAAVGLVGEVVTGHVVFGLAFGLVVVLAAVDYWRLRASTESPKSVADRLVAYVAVLAIGAASHGLDAIEAMLTAAL